MIKAIRSDNNSFKEVHFREGFNVVLAERTKEILEIIKNLEIGGKSNEIK